MSIFVHGPEQEGRFQARQSRTASAAVARCHRLREEAVVLLAQNREAIDRGAFHNDVVAVANENVLLFHPDAFQDRAALLAAIGNTWKDGGVPLHLLAPSQDVLCLKEAVSTYLFNSQLVTTSPGRMQIIAPARCQNSRAVQTVLGEWLSGDNPLQDICYVDLSQSMANGGDPACLRLRVVLTPQEEASVAPGVVMTPDRIARLKAWVRNHYRDGLVAPDLGYPSFPEEIYAALDVAETGTVRYATRT